jgi:hypothetical protein
VHRFGKVLTHVSHGAHMLYIAYVKFQHFKSIYIDAGGF